MRPATDHISDGDRCCVANGLRAPLASSVDRSEGGNLSKGFLTTRRVWLLVNIAVTVALVPALFTSGHRQPAGPVAVSAGATFETVPVVANAAPGRSPVVPLGPNDIAAAATTTTTTAPAPPVTAPRVARVARPAVPTTVARPTTAAPRPRPAATKPAPPPEPAPAPAPAPTTSARSESGKASWYDHQAGICAHKSLPFGTVVTVTNTANGKHTQCTVGDRGPYVDGWIIDLNPREFEQLAPTSTGVISVRLTW